MAKSILTAATTNAPAESRTAANGSLIIGGHTAGNASGFIEGVFLLVNTPDRMLFLQGGWNRYQKRNLLSAGLGQRHFLTSDWALGYNLFYDQETSQHHNRYGIGAEVWHNLFKLAMNGYFPLSTQRMTGQHKNEQAQAASSVELSASAYLPSVPKLSASVQYRQFFGANVAVVSFEQRQHNPKAWSLGLGYTPVPLFTVDYHYLTERLRPSRHQLGLSITYRFAIPLRQQLDPHQVATLRSFQKQRFDHVQRQREMVLKYTQVSKPPVTTNAATPSAPATPQASAIPPPMLDPARAAAAVQAIASQLRLLAP